jgi:hypothetical protein
MRVTHLDRGHRGRSRGVAREGIGPRLGALPRDLPTNQASNQSINHKMKGAATSGLAVTVEMVLLVAVCLPLPISTSTGGGG